MLTQASIVTLFASIAAAQLHAPVGEPKGNAITRPLNEIVPACEPFTIKWEPSTPNTVSVLLLKGPATNVVKFGPALAQGIANSGSLAWTPASSLERTQGPNGYGIQIIDDVTGQFQYSTQFGISKGSCGDSSSAPASPSASGPVANPSKEGYPVANPPDGGYPVASPSVHASSAIKSPVHSPPPTAPYPTKPAGNTPVYGTGAPPNNSIIQPTGSLTVPSGLRPTSTGNSTNPTLPESTAAASALQAGLSLAGAAVAFALML